MPYSSYDHDKLETAETMRIERRMYFEAKDREIAPYASLPIAQLLSMRSESAAAEQAIFDDLKERAAAWEEQAGRTLLLDKTDEYESDYFRFQVSGFDVLVKNELLAEALNALPERKRDIILLSYFLDMSDAEIGELLNVVRTTVFRHRKSALAKIKQYLEGKADDEYR